MDDYELLDLGAGARLERFGDRVVDRPHPAAYGERADPAAWDATTLFYVPGEGWHGPAPVEPWMVTVRDLTIELRPTDTGQVGVFPEQEPSWSWLDGVVRERTEAGTSPSVLNLFAYTGVATLVAAAAGAAVTHVDAAKSAVAWARRNAELSRLEGRPVRWLVDDVAGFVARELRRGRRYDGVVLDPPSYGHGARGRAWRFEDDLPSLLADCARLAGAPDGFVLLTGHTPGFGPDALAGVLGETWRVAPRRIDAGDLEIVARSGRRLELGGFARWAGSA